MTILDLIYKKQNNKMLNEFDFDFFIKQILSNSIKDYQISSFLMLIWCKGLSNEETYYLTKAMVNNGKVIDYKDSTHPIIDKHSTGGIGDKVSLILVPIIASFGINFAKMSGRGLGYTGGTIDKLESVDIKTELKEDEYIKVLKENNMFIVSQSKDITPSDKIIYSIRDTSGTINNISLIASSIMSKKIATNTDKIYLDVKIGDGAFFPTINDGEAFAKLCIDIGKRFNKEVIIHFTNMEKPLGRSIGNMIEVKEAINFLNFNFESNELKDLIYEFASDILMDNNIAASKSDAYLKIDEKLKNGIAYNKFVSWARTQESQFNFDNINSIYAPKFKCEILASQSGYIDFVSNKEFGYILIKLKGGRENKQDVLDFYSGIYLNKTYNEYANKNDVIFTIYCSSPIDDEVITRLKNNIKYYESKQKDIKNIIGLIK